jgi:hypothetical protein
MKRRGVARLAAVSVAMWAAHLIVLRQLAAIYKDQRSIWMWPVIVGS